METTTEQRAMRRHKRVALTGAVSIIARGIGAVVSLATVPLTIDYLEAERYGLWMTISSLLALFGFLDLGIGNGLVNSISKADGARDREIARRYTSNAIFLMITIACALGTIFLIAYPWVPWSALFNVASPPGSNEVPQATLAVVFCLLVNLPLAITARIQAGYQEGYINSVWSIGGSLASLGCLLIAVHEHARLPWLILSVSGAPIASLLLNGIDLFSRRRTYLQPRVADVTREYIHELLHSGSQFFVIRVAMAFALLSDNIIIAQVLGANSVAEYAICAKMYGVIPMITGVFLAALWPAYGESLVRGDSAWAKTMLRKSTRSAVLLSAIGTLPLVVFGKGIVELWANSAVIPSTALLLGFAASTTISALVASLATFLNGIGQLRVQVLSAAALALVAPVLKVILAHSFGLPGIIWAAVGANILCTCLPLAIHVPRVLRGI